MGQSIQPVLDRGSLCLAGLVISDKLNDCDLTVVEEPDCTWKVCSLLSSTALTIIDVGKPQYQHNRLCQASLALQPLKSSKIQGVGLGAN